MVANSPTIDEISTHTLTWSVTGQARSINQMTHEISTHTLTWSVTKLERTVLYG